jgi:hypothetical protein
MPSFCFQSPKKCEVSEIVDIVVNECRHEFKLSPWNQWFTRRFSFRPGWHEACIVMHKSLSAFSKIVLAPLGGRPRLAQNALGLEVPHCGWVAKQPPTLVPRPETDGALFFDDVVLLVVRAALPAQLCSSFRASHR